MSDIRQEDFGQLFQALTAGPSAGKAMAAASSGYDSERNRLLEARKARLAEEIAKAKAASEVQTGKFNATKDLVTTGQSLQKGLTDQVIKDPSGKVTGTTPAIYSKTQADSAMEALRKNWPEAYGDAPSVMGFQAQTGTKETKPAAGSMDPAKALKMWEATKPARELLGGVNQSWLGMKGTQAAEATTMRTASANALRQYKSFAPALAAAFYRSATGDTRLSDADAQVRALPLLPQYGIDSTETVAWKEAVLDDILKNPKAATDYGTGDSEDAFMQGVMMKRAEIGGAKGAAQPAPTGAVAPGTIPTIEEIRAEKARRGAK